MDEITITNTSALENALSCLTPFQQDIVVECMDKKSGGLNLPMGSGKTMLSTIVALLLNNSCKGGILIIVAKSLLLEWVNEFEDKFPGLSYEVLHNDYMKKTQLVSWKPSSTIILTTPEMISKSYKEYNIDVKFFYYERQTNFGPEIKHYHKPDKPFGNIKNGIGIIHSHKWDCVVIDEVQVYENINTIRCLALSSICAEYRWLLSGTPFEEPRINKLFGYYMLLNYSNFPRNLSDFKKYITDEDYSGIINTLVLRDKNENFTIPKINRDIVSHPLSEVEAIIYINIKNILKEMSEKLKHYKKNRDTENTKKFSSYITGMINHLRQILICPLITITSVALDCADLVHKHELSNIFMKNINMLGIEGWLNDVNSLYSSRTKAVIEKLEEDKDEKVLIFCSFRRIYEVVKYYSPQQRPIFTLSPSMKLTTRRKTLTQWQESDNGILFLTYSIGANGLNLQCCNTVYILDFWWNISTTEQAIARILRYGQKAKTVNVRYFTSNTGIENGIFKMHKQKKKIANEIMTGPIKSCIDNLKTKDIILLLDSEDNVKILDEVTLTNN